MAERFPEQETDPPGPVAFTHQWYRQFFQELRANGCQFRSFSMSLDDGDVVLRHDVDLPIDAAVTIARIQAGLGIESPGPPSCVPVPA